MMKRLNKKSRMKRELHVRFCEGFGVKFRLTHSTISEVQQSGDTFFSSTDTAYLIFMIIGILGYFSVPTVANYVVHAGGGNSMLSKVNSMVVSTGAAAMGTVSGMAASKGKSGGMVADRNGDGHRNMAYGMAEGSGQDYFRDKLSGK